MNAACGAKTSNGKEAMFEELHRKMNAFWNNDRTLSQTDPEYVKLFSDFAYGEVVNEPGATSDPGATRPAPWRSSRLWSAARVSTRSK